MSHENNIRPFPESQGDMSEPKPAFPIEPITDERYGAGVRIGFPTGEVTLFLAPHRPFEEPDDLGRLIAASDRDDHVIDAVIAADQSKPEESNIKTQSNTEPPTEKAPRVEVEGRAGKDPVLRETAKGVKIAKFPLAEHPNGQEGETVWHTIVSFKDLAQKVSETVHKGDQVKVIGYRNEREHNGKTVQEINAVVVKPPKLPTG